MQSGPATTSRGDRKPFGLLAVPDRFASLSRFGVCLFLLALAAGTAQAQSWYDGDRAYRKAITSASDGTTKLDYEREQCLSGSSTPVAWIRIPSLPTNVDTVIYIYYGNSGATGQQAATLVWDSNYRGVGRMDESAARTGSTNK